jgi:hypothetical protein
MGKRKIEVDTLTLSLWPTLVHNLSSPQPQSWGNEVTAQQVRERIALWQQTTLPASHWIPKPGIEYFWDNISPEPNSGCWLWLGKLNKHGYAYFGGGKRGRTISAYRWAYEFYKGRIPVHKAPQHLCRTPSCVNPDHINIEHWTGARARQLKWRKENRELANQQVREQRKRRNNPDEVYKHAVKRNYGLSLEEYYNLVHQQENRCAICGESETRWNRARKLRRLSVDHDHITGQVRGLLCHGCNMLIGFSYESMERLKWAIDYLRIHKTNSVEISQTNDQPAPELIERQWLVHGEYLHQEDPNQDADHPE